MSTGLKLLASLIDSKSGLTDYVRMRLGPEVFLSEVEREAYEFVNTFVLKYAKLPSRATCKEGGLGLLPSKLLEPTAFYWDKAKERYVFYRLKSLLKTVETDLNEDQPAIALDRMTETMQLVQMFVHKDRITDFMKDAQTLIEAEYKLKQKQGDAYGLRFGWSYVDAMTGGLTGGDFIVFVGRPGSGKTYLMLHGATEAWKLNRVPMFVSMEMKPLPIMQRVAAMMTKVPVTNLKQASLTSKQEGRMKMVLKGFTEDKPPFWIIDGALSSSVSDVILLANQLKPDVVFIDGAYLLRHPNQRMAKWEKIAENAERLKGELAETMNVPVVASYQFNRGAKKYAEAGTNDTSNIAGSDVIGQLASVVFGLLQEESVETLRKRTVEILKGRNGEVGTFDINWNFDEGPDYMNFTQIKKSSKDMKYA